MKTPKAKILLQPGFPELEELFLGAGLDFDMLDERNCPSEPSRYSLIVLHKSLRGESSPLLLRYVILGGGLLALNSALEATSPDIAKLLGARAVHRLGRCEYDCIITNPKHPAMRGAGGFSVTAQPYQFEFNTIRPGPPQPRKSLLFEYRYNNTVGTGAWEQSFGLGRVACCGMAELPNSALARLLLNMARWAGGISIA